MKLYSLEVDRNGFRRQQSGHSQGLSSSRPESGSTLNAVGSPPKFRPPTSPSPSTAVDSCGVSTRSNTSTMALLLLIWPVVGVFPPSRLVDRFATLSFAVTVVALFFTFFSPPFVVATLFVTDGPSFVKPPISRPSTTTVVGPSSLLSGSCDVTSGPVTETCWWSKTSSLSLTFTFPAA